MDLAVNVEKTDGFPYGSHCVWWVIQHGAVNFSNLWKFLLRTEVSTTAWVKLKSLHNLRRYVWEHWSVFALFNGNGNCISLADASVTKDIIQSIDLNWTTGRKNIDKREFFCYTMEVMCAQFHRQSRSRIIQFNVHIVLFGMVIVYDRLSQVSLYNHWLVLPFNIEHPNLKYQRRKIDVKIVQYSTVYVWGCNGGGVCTTVHNVMHMNACSLERLKIQ